MAEQEHLLCLGKPMNVAAETCCQDLYSGWAPLRETFIRYYEWWQMRAGIIEMGPESKVRHPVAARRGMARCVLVMAVEFEATRAPVPFNSEDRRLVDEWGF